VPARSVDWRPQARHDLLAIISYIADDNPDAAQSIKDDIEQKVSQLPCYPELYRQGRVPGTREMPVRNNYVVVYAVEDRSIQVLRVLHGARQWPPVAG
jgi:addiction module RelE/StbE family toxin